MNNVAVASKWFRVTETFCSNGEVAMSIMDIRDGTHVHGVAADFPTHIQVWDELATNKGFGILPSVKAKFLN